MLSSHLQATQPALAPGACPLPPSGRGPAPLSSGRQSSWETLGKLPKLSFLHILVCKAGPIEPPVCPREGRGLSHTRSLLNSRPGARPANTC